MGSKAYPARDDDNRMRITPEPRHDGDSVVVVSHNWADRCTWYSQSQRHAGVVLSSDGLGLTFSSGIPRWIDLSHGRVYREDLISSAYLPVVKVDGQVAVERAPFALTGGDFWIDYEAGTVTFTTSQVGKTITADFSAEHGSMFVVAPTPGRLIWVEKSEVQFSSDIELNDTVHFQAWAYNPSDFPNKIPVSERTTYKTARDFIDEAQGVYPTVPAFGGAARGSAVGHLVFPFNYLQLKELRSSYGLEIRVWLDSDVPFGGTFATATFYCSSFAE